VSGKLPQNYMIHAVVIAIAITVAMVLFLKKMWG
jgi:hypothetical protein